MDFKYCPRCGSSLTIARPDGEHRARSACGTCDFVHYRNPKILVCCLATYKNRLLWIRRGTEPRKGWWAHPAGFMEERERPEEAARRELFEETRGTVDPEKLELFAVGSLPDISEVYIFLRGELESAFVGRTAEALDVRLFDESSAPWSELAYPELENVLRCFYHDHARKNYGVYCCDWSRGLLRFREAARGVG